ncbi:MAG: hypothetical protein K8R53_08925 [Bacteroidales bacterium]|jgi:hypothetical protein|nr:hypothetical protein [Bacteroidales bacterium]
MLQHDDGTIFACSQTSYADQIGGHSESRIYVSVQFDTLPKTFAVLDTGAPWCILNEEQAKELNPKYKDEAIDTKCLNIRGEKTEGVLIRLPVTICAEQGEDIIIEGTVFVPQDERDLPNFIGLDGLLSRIKFAINPQSNIFYFGPIAQ